MNRTRSSQKDSHKTKDHLGDLDVEGEVILEWSYKTGTVRIT